MGSPCRLSAIASGLSKTWRCYGRLRHPTARRRHAHLPIDRSHLPAGLRAQAPDPWARGSVPDGPGVSHAELCCPGQDRRGVRGVGPPLRLRERGPGHPLQEGPEQGGDRPTAARSSCCRRRRRTRRAHRHRPGEGVGVAVVAIQAPALRGPATHGMGTADGLRQPLLLLPVGPRLRPGLLEDQRLRPLSGVDLAQRPRVGQAPARQVRHRLRGPRQRLRLL